MHSHALAALATSLLLSASLGAQFVLPSRIALGSKLQIPGPTGTAATHKLDVMAEATKVAGYTVNGCVGTCVDKLLGHIWVSARRDTSNLTNPHKLFEFWWDPKANNGQGAWHVEMYDQPSGTLGSAWGIRDLAAGDGSTILYIYGGSERSVVGNKVFAFDVTKQASPNQNRSKGWTSSADWKTDNLPAAITVVRALAYDPNRNTMYTGDFNNPIAEFKQDGTLVKSFTPSAPARSTYGMAYDPLRKTVIVCGQQGSAKGNTPPNGVRMVAWELDPNGTAFVETGTMFFSADLTIAHTGTGAVPGGVSGGCDLTIEKRSLPTNVPNVFNVVSVPVLTWLAQADSDTVIQMYGRFQHHPYDSTGAALPKNSGGDIGAKGDAPYVGNSAWGLTLSKSSAANATLYVSLGSGNIPFAFAPFVAGSVVSLDLGSPLFLPVGGVSVQSGSAVLPAPIPNIAGLVGISAFFQWVEVTGTGQAMLSTMGGVVFQK